MMRNLRAFLEGLARLLGEVPRADYLLFMLSAAIGALVAIWHYVQVAPEILYLPNYEAWFDADIPRVFENFFKPLARQYRSYFHPFSALFFSSFARGLDWLVDDRVVSTGAIMALNAALWTGSLYALLRLSRLGRADAALFTAFALSTASAVFWIAIPESFAIGATLMLLTLLFTIAVARLPGSERYLFIALILTVAVTITNAVVGAIAILERFGLRRLIQASIVAAVVSLALWLVQGAFYPKAEFFKQRTVKMLTRNWITKPAPRIHSHHPRSFFVHSAVMPQHAFNEVRRNTATQGSAIGSSGPVGLAAAAGWLILLLAGFYAILVKKSFTAPVKWAVLGGLAFNYVLHHFFGHETFLYSFHWIAFLVIVASHAVFLGWPLRALAAVLTVLFAVNNEAQFLSAANQLARPDRAPRLSSPENGPASEPVEGARIVDGACFGFSGAMSPAANSFGVQITPLKTDGSAVSAEPAQLEASGAPVTAVTSAFAATWTPILHEESRPGRRAGWRLDLEPRNPSVSRFRVNVSSDGPCGGTLWYANPKEGYAPKWTVLNLRWALQAAENAPANVTWENGRASVTIELTKPRLYLIDYLYVTGADAFDDTTPVLE
ncbi:MAG TPA: DUF6080 domain-containing protein [Bdellovibrionales bacterium]|nr:DUF6080 domain-containing protein [Bdellovibrionales bacterium]